MLFKCFSVVCANDTHMYSDIVPAPKYTTTTITSFAATGATPPPLPPTNYSGCTIRIGVIEITLILVEENSDTYYNLGMYDLIHIHVLIE